MYFSCIRTFVSEKETQLNPEFFRKKKKHLMFKRQIFFWEKSKVFVDRYPLNNLNNQLLTCII